jgi:hypothetical protein
MPFDVRIARMGSLLSFGTAPVKKQGCSMLHTVTYILSLPIDRTLPI